MLLVWLLALKLTAVIVTKMSNFEDTNTSGVLFQTPATKQVMGGASGELTTFTGGAKQQQRDGSVAGTVHGEFRPCTWQNYNGVLTAGSKAVVFTGSFFLFEKTVILQWDEIRQVSNASTSTDGSKGGSIEIVLSNDTTHTFSGLHAPDKVWLLLMKLHNDALLGRSSRQKTPGRSLQRRNSDPASATPSKLDEPAAEDRNTASSEEATADRAVVRFVTSMAERLQFDSIRLRNDTTQEVAISDEEKPHEQETQQAARLLGVPMEAKHDGLVGQMYMTADAVYFSAKRYFWEHVVVTVPWSAVKQVLLSDNGVLEIRTKEPAIRTDGGSESTTAFDFSDIQKVDQVYVDCIRLHNANLRAAAAATTATGIPSTAYKRRRTTLRRMTSDPMDLASSQRRLLEFDSDELDEQSSPEKESTCVSRDDVFTTPAGTLGKNVCMGDEDDEWATAVATNASSYTNVVIQDYVLNDCSSLDQFFELFVADTAKYSLSKFLKSIGESQLRCTEWKPQQDDNDNKENVNTTTMTRVVKYMHPVNAPMAPPEAEARKEQRVHRYGNQGILLTTETFVEDVPLTDCFYVAERIRAVPTDDKSAVSVSMEFGITFVKSTMFKGIISKQTTSEFIKYFEDMAQYMAEMPKDDTATARNNGEVND